MAGVPPSAESFAGSSALARSALGRRVLLAGAGGVVLSLSGGGWMAAAASAAAAALTGVGHIGGWLASSVGGMWSVSSFDVRARNAYYC